MAEVCSLTPIAAAKLTIARLNRSIAMRALLAITIAWQHHQIAQLILETRSHRDCKTASHLEIEAVLIQTGDLDLLAASDGSKPNFSIRSIDRGIIGDRI
jgi:hypothetical protein